MFDGELFGEQMVEVVKDYLERVVTPLQAELVAVKSEFAAFKAAGAARIDAATIRAIVDEAIGALPAAKDGVGLAGALIDRGGSLIVTLSDGSTRELGQVVGKDASQDSIRAMVDEAVALIPTAKDGDAGRDADPDFVREVVAEAVAALPPAPAGKDADPEVIRQMVADAVAALPPAPAGKDADPELVREMVVGAVAALPPPVAGRDADPEFVRQVVAEAVAALPPAPAGKDADPEVIRQMVADAVAALPPAPAGKDADIEEIRNLVADAVAELPPPVAGRDADPEFVRQVVGEAVAALPPAQPGEPGKDADPEILSALVVEAVSHAVDALPKAKDGVSLAGALIDRDGNLVVTLSDGTTRELGQVVGRDADMDAIERSIADRVDALPKAEDGVDGFGFDDLGIEQTGERTFVFRFTQGARTKEFELKMPVVIDRDVFKAGANYEQGDGVTWAGSFWIARRNTSAKPGEGEDWRLAVKRGRDGRDATKPA